MRRVGLHLTAFALAAGSLVAGPAWARDYVQQAEALQAKGDFKGALIELRNAVRDNPQNGEMRLKLAKLDLMLGDMLAAEKDARAARDLNYDPVASTRIMTEAYLGQQHFDQLLKDFSPDVSDPALKATILTTRAVALFALNRADEANEALAAAEEADPKSVQPLLVQVRLAIGRGDREAAKARLDQARRIAPDDPDVRQAQSLFDRSGGDFANALTEINAALDKTPHAPALLLDRSAIELGLNQDDKAAEDDKAVLAILPNSVQALYIQATLTARKRDFAGADAILAKLGPHVADVPRGLFLQALVKLELGQVAQAEEVATRAVARAPGDLDAAKLLARIELQRKKPAEAVKAIEPIVLAGHGDLEAIDQLARAYALSGQNDKAIATFQQALAKAPDNPALHEQLAAVRLAAGDPDGAVADATAALDKNPKDTTAAEQLFYAATATGDRAKVAAATKHIIDAQGETSVALNLKGLAALDDIDLPAARAAFEKAVATQPDFLPAKTNLARVAMMEGDTGQQTALLADILKQQPNAEPALSIFAGLSLRDNHPENAVAALEAAHATAPASDETTIRLAALYLDQQQADKAIALLQKDQDRLSHSPPLLNALAQAQIRKNDDGAASATLARLLEQNPGAIGARRELAALQLKADHAEEARNTIQAGLTLAPRDLSLLGDYVGIDFKSRGLDVALGTADTLAQQAQDAPGIRVLRGDLYLADKQYDQAIKTYQDAQAATPSAFFVLRIANAQRAGGHADAAIKTLADWYGAHPADTAVGEALSEFQINEKDWAGAARTLRPIAQATPRNALVLNNLAYVLQQTGDIKDATDLAWRAYTLDSRGQTADTLGWILVAANDMARGLPLLRAAYTEVPNDPRLGYHLAVALKDAHQSDQARQVLQTVLAKDTTFDERPDAQHLLDTLKGT